MQGTSVLVPVLDLYMHTGRERCFHVQILISQQIMANTKDTNYVSIHKTHYIYIFCVFFYNSVAEECWSKHYLLCVPVGICNSLPECVDMVLHLCCTAEHTHRKLPEQMADLLDQLGLHNLHCTGTAGRWAHHSATHQGEDYRCVQPHLGSCKKAHKLSTIHIQLGPQNLYQSLAFSLCNTDSHKTMSFNT